MTIQAQPESRQTRHRYGMILILLAGVFFTLMSLGVRMLRNDFSAHTLVFYRCLFQALVVTPWALGLCRGIPSVGLSRARTHLLRGTFGISSMFLLYVALGELPLGLANLLAMTSVLWAALLSRLLLKESWTSVQASAALVSLIGIGITLWGSEQGLPAWQWTYFGVAAALGCGLFMGTALTVLRHMRQTVGAAEIVFFFGICGALLTLPAVVWRWEWPTSQTQWIWLLAIGVTATAGQILMTVGFRYTTTLVGTVCKLMEPVFNLAVGFHLLHEVPPGGFWIGATLVVVGMVTLMAAGAQSRVSTSETVGV